MGAAHARCGRGAQAVATGALAFMLVACAGITPKRMVPEAMAGPERTVPQRVRVMPVTGTRDTFFGGAAFPTKEQFHEALVATIAKSGLFAGVSPSDGDMDLTVSVLSIDQTGFLPLTVRLVTNYKFTARDGALLWSETYDSSFSANDFAGASRTVNANEGAVRENLKAFVQGARERFRP
jgi:hypothetical protein